MPQVESAKSSQEYAALLDSGAGNVIDRVKNQVIDSDEQEQYIEDIRLRLNSGSEKIKARVQPDQLDKAESALREAIQFLILKLRAVIITTRQNIEKERLETAKDLFVRGKINGAERGLNPNPPDVPAQGLFLETLLKGVLADVKDPNTFQNVLNQTGYNDQKLMEMISNKDPVPGSVTFGVQEGKDKTEIERANKQMEKDDIAAYVTGTLKRAEVAFDGLNTPGYKEYNSYVISTLADLGKEANYHLLEGLLVTPEVYKSRQIPERPKDALSGSQFMIALMEDPVMKADPDCKKPETRMYREMKILEQIRAGNIPDFLRNLKEVELGEGNTKIKVRVMPDYLSIGDNDDFIRIPMSPLLARQIALSYHMELPTIGIVEETYQQADIQLDAPILPAGPHQESNQWYLDHNTAVNRALAMAGDERSSAVVPNSLLLAGHKKDVVYSRYLESHTDSLDFYGLYFHGEPIQTSPAHPDTYADYSHGFRPVSGTVTIETREEYKDKNGQTKTRTVDRKEMSYSEALGNPAYASILNGHKGGGATINTQKNYRKTPFRGGEANWG